MKTIKRVKLCLIAFFAIVFASMTLTLVATNVKRADAAAALDTATFVMDDTGLTLRTNNQVGPRFKVKMEKGLADRIRKEAITLSFLIAPRAAFDKVNYNYETLLAAAKSATGTSAPARIKDADKTKIYDEDDYSWASLVINTSEANRTLDMSVVAYITYSDGAGSIINRYAATDVEKVRGNLYNVVNTTALSDAVVAKDILENSEFGWYGAGNYPIEISTNEQAEVLKNSGANFSGKVVLANSSVNIPSEIAGNVKTVKEQAVGGNKAEIVLGSGTSYAVDMGTLDGNVVKATIGGKAVSYANGNVTLDFDFKNRLIKHGDQTLTVTVEKDGQYTNYNKKVLIVTKEIENLADLKAAVALDGNHAKYGYYRLKDDIVCDISKVDENGKPAEWIGYGSTSVTIDGKKLDFWKNDAGNYGFRGTFDGNNKTISSIFYSTGLFGTIGNGAVIKNITLTQRDYLATRMLLGYSMVGAKFENVTVNVNGKGTTTLPDVSKWQVGGLLTAIYAHSNEFKNVTINSEKTDVDTIFGSCSYYSYPAVGATNKFEECVITTKSLIGLACINNTNKTVTTAAGVNGLTVNVPRDDETATDKIIVGQAYRYPLVGVAEITGIKFGNSDFTAYTFADGTLTINADAFGPSDTGSKTLVVTAKNEKGYVMNFNLNVTVEFVATPVALEGTREIVLSSGNNFSVDLGDYTNATVLAATLGGETITYSDGTLTVTDEFKANKQKHGNQDLNVLVQKDGTYYNVTTNVLVVTQDIKTVGEFVTVSGKIYGYYRLANDLLNTGDSIDVSGSGDWKNADGQSGFRGTFDGNGKTISGYTKTNGMFGIVGQGAVIKNFIYEATIHNAGGNVIARSITGATVEGVTINIKSVKGTLSADSEGGVITGLMSHTTLYKNVTINASGIDLDTLFGKSYGQYKAEKANTFVGCTVNAKSLAGLVHSNVVISAEGIEGLTVNKGV